MSGEEWRPVPGLPGYEASSLGRVLSRRRGAPRILSIRPNATGYPSAQVFVNGRPTKWTVHRMVATAFYGPRPEGLEVRHLDGDKNNNRADNLRYGTRSENEMDKVQHGTHQQASKTHCISGHPLDGDNLRATPQARVCVTCRRRANREYARRQRAAAKAAA